MFEKVIHEDEPTVIRLWMKDSGSEIHCWMALISFLVSDSPCDSILNKDHKQVKILFDVRRVRCPGVGCQDEKNLCNL